MMIAYLDLDHFKEVNDFEGHPVGDKPLVTVARTIDQASRQSYVFDQVYRQESS